MIGTGIATLISGLAGAGASIFGAGKQASAAEQASQTQAQAAQQALDFAKQVYQQRLADLSPYKNLGASSLAGLAALTGIPAAPAGAATSSVPFSFAATPSYPQAEKAFQSGWNYYNQQTPVAPQDVPIMMEAPDGSRKLVPQNLYQYYLAKGAKGVFDASAGAQVGTKTPNRPDMTPPPVVPPGSPQTTPPVGWGGGIS